MSSKVKLFLNMVVIIVVFSIIVVSVGALLTKESHFLDVPGTRVENENLSMEIIGKVNGEDFFTISFVDGKKTQNKETIPAEDMTFSAERTVITLDMVFENHSENVLYIQITGIYLDKIKFPNNPRFITSTFVNDVQRAMVEESDKTGTITLQLEPMQEDIEPNVDDGSLINFTIRYELNTYNRNINNEKQDLVITISKERFDLD